MDDTASLLRYLQSALSTELAVAPFDLCGDSQTQWVISQLDAISDEIAILDLGCGNLRLLNAISQSNSLKHRVSYVATDKVAPAAPRAAELPYRFIPAEALGAQSRQSFDVVVVMNVIHEVPILECADIIEQSRRLMKDGGRLLLADMARLPDGEFRAVTYYPHEVAALFPGGVDQSYISKSGVPVVAFSISRTQIPFYPQLRQRLVRIMAAKRDCYSELACHLPLKERDPSTRKLLEMLSLNKDDVHDLGYLMLMSGFANFRIVEYEKSEAERDYLRGGYEASDAIMQCHASFFRENGREPTFYEVYDCLGGLYPNRTLDEVLRYLTEMPGLYFAPDPSSPGTSELEATEMLDVYDESSEYYGRGLRELGFLWLREKLYERIVGELMPWENLLASPGYHWTFY